MSRARYTVAPAFSAAAAVPSAESESITTTSSTRGTRSTRAACKAPTTPATVRSSSRAGTTTLIRAPARRLPSSSASAGQSRQCEVRRPYHASARLCTLSPPGFSRARLAPRRTVPGQAIWAGIFTVRQRPSSPAHRPAGDTSSWRGPVRPPRWVGAAAVDMSAVPGVIAPGTADISGPRGIAAERTPAAGIPRPAAPGCRDADRGVDLRHGRRSAPRRLPNRQYSYIINLNNVPRPGFSKEEPCAGPSSRGSLPRRGKTPWG